MPKKYRNKKIISNPASPTNSVAQTASANPATARGLPYKAAAKQTGSELIAAGEIYAKRDVLFSFLVAFVVIVVLIILYFIFR